MSRGESKEGAAVEASCQKVDAGVARLRSPLAVPPSDVRYTIHTTDERGSAGLSGSVYRGTDPTHLLLASEMLSM